MRDEQPDRLEHQAAAGIALADPVADLPGLGDAVADVAERDAADQRAALVLEDEERHRRAERVVLAVARKPLAPGGAVELVGRPARLPGLEEAAARRRAAPPIRDSRPRRGSRSVTRSPFSAGEARRKKGSENMRDRGCSDGELAGGGVRQRQRVADRLVGRRACRPGRPR